MSEEKPRISVLPVPNQLASQATAKPQATAPVPSETPAAPSLLPKIERTPTNSRRRSRRLGCKGSVELRFVPRPERASGTLLNLSESGCRILIERSAYAMEDGRVEVYCSVNSTTLILGGGIRQITEKGRHAELGIEFMGVSVRKDLQLKELITELIESQKKSYESAQLLRIIRAKRT